MIDTDLKVIIGVGHLLQPWVLRMIIYILGSKCIPTMVTLGAKNDYIYSRFEVYSYNGYPGCLE